MSELNSDAHYIYYCKQEFLRRNGVANIVNKRVRNAVLGCNLKNDRMISVRFQGKPFIIMVIQVYAPTRNTEEAEVEQFYEDLQDLLELTPQKHVLFIIGDWNAKVGSQETPGITGKFGFGIQNTAAAAKSLQSYLTLCDPIDGSPPGSPIPGILQARTLEWVAISFSNAWKWKLKVSRAKANRVLPRERTGHSKHPLPTTQEKTLHINIMGWSIPKMTEWTLFISKANHSISW